MNIKYVTLVMVMALISLFRAEAAITVNLNGNVETEVWTDMSSTNNPGYPGFLNFLDAWPSPIASDAGSTGNGEFDKISGGGYPASESIYPFAVAGTFSVSSTTSLFDVTNVVLQLDTASGTYLTPTLSYNGGSQAISANFLDLTSGEFIQGFGGTPSSTFNMVAQWDLSSIAASITDYEIIFEGQPHDAIYKINLDSSDGEFVQQVIPEPGTWALVLVGLGSLGLLRRFSKK
ncbi:MAG: PEP-CTERM sorting domain-containing protein [Verrucomicrobiota bacterium]